MKTFSISLSATVVATFVVWTICQPELVSSQHSQPAILVDEEAEEIVVDEISDAVHKQELLFDSTYNSSFTISLPLFSLVVPGTGKASGLVRLSVSHFTLWSLLMLALTGLVYPAIIGPKGKIYYRSFGNAGFDDKASPFIEPTILDHLKDIVNVTQVYEDVWSLVPLDATRECLRRSVCEVYESSSDFGIVGMALRSVYSADEYGLLGEIPQGARLAAKDGLDPTMKCRERYSRCLVSTREVYHSTVEYFLGD